MGDHTPIFNQVFVKKGENFTIELDEMACAGYLWQFNIVAGRVSDQGRTYESKPFDPLTSPIGGLSRLHAHFRAEEVGVALIEAEQRRPFDTPDTPPATRLLLKVNIR